MLNAYGKNYRYMIVCMFQSSEPVFFLFPFFFFFHFGLCVCVCVCVYVLMKNIFLVIHYSAHPMVFFHSFYMFDILAKPVRRGSQIGELQYLAFNNHCQYNS